MHIPVNLRDRFIDSGVDLAVFDEFTKAWTDISDGLSQRAEESTLIATTIFLKPLLVAWRDKIF